MMRNACRDACTVAITVVRACGTAVGHSAKHLPTIADELVRRLAFGTADEADRTRILLQAVQVMTPVDMQRARPESQ